MCILRALAWWKRTVTLFFVFSIVNFVFLWLSICFVEKEKKQNKQELVLYISPVATDDIYWKKNGKTHRHTCATVSVWTIFSHKQKKKKRGKIYKKNERGQKKVPNEVNQSVIYIFHISYGRKFIYNTIFIVLFFFSSYIHTICTLHA